MRGYLRIDLASNCNIRCIMCQAYNGMAVSNINFLDFDKFVSQTKGQLGDWSTIQLGNVSEATIHPKFNDILKYIRNESEATIHIVTNGKTLYHNASTINEIGNCLVQISVDSIDKEMHEYIREGSDYDKLMSNLKLLDTQKTRVLLSFTLMNSNIKEYDRMVQFCSDNGYSMSAFPMILREDHGSIIPFNLLRESLWFHQHALQDWLKKYYGEDYEGIVLGSSSGATNLGIDEFSCNAHENDLVINDTGNATLCYKSSAGNLNDDSLENIWTSEEAEKFRDKVNTDRSPCFKCDYRQRCLSPSMSLLENHFSESIFSHLDKQVVQALSFPRAISDQEALKLFIENIKNNCGIFDIRHEEKIFKANRVIGLSGLEPVYDHRETLEAGTRHELHDLMIKHLGSFNTIELLEIYKGHNIVLYHDSYLVVPITLGSINLRIKENTELREIIRTNSLEQARNEIDLIPEINRSPILIGTYKSYNLVEYQGKFFGAPLSLGPLNLTRQQDRTRAGILEEETCDKIKALINFQRLSDRLAKVEATPYFINKLLKQIRFFLNNIFAPGKNENINSAVSQNADENQDNPQSPKLISSLSGYNLVAYLNRYWAIPQILGHVDLSLESGQNKPNIIQSIELTQLKNQVIESTPKLKSSGLFSNNKQIWNSLELPIGEINPIPSMITDDEARFLHWLGRNYFKGQGKIIDLGPLAGGSTYALASGVAQNPKISQKQKYVWSYDLWSFCKDWGRFFKDCRLRNGDSFLHLYLKNIKKFKPFVRANQEDLEKTIWNQGKVEILMIDAAKSPEILHNIVRQFFPHLMPGHSIVIHQDFVSAECPWIHVTQGAFAKYFEPMESPYGGSVAFKYISPIPPEMINEDIYFEASLDEKQALMASAYGNLIGWNKLCVFLAEANLYAIHNQFDQAREIIDAVKSNPDMGEEVRFDLNLLENTWFQATHS